MNAPASPLSLLWALTEPKNLEPSVEPDRLQFRGFYSFTGLHRSNPAPQYAYVPYGDQTFGIQPHGLDWRASSKLGLMINGQFDQEWGFGVQYLVRQASSREPRLRTPLAYLNWRPGSWDIKFGRSAPGVTLAEEVLHADYGHLWAKPPVEIYAFKNRPQLDGLNVSHFSEWQGWYLNVQGAYGVSDYHSRGHRRRLTSNAALSVTASQDDWLLRVAHHSQHIDILSLPANSAFLASLRAQVPEAFRHELSEYNLAQVSTNLSLRWTPGPWSVQAEVQTSHNNKAWTAGQDGGYALIGRRWGAWTPYLMRGAARQVKPIETRFSPSVNAQVNALVNSFQGAQHSTALGLRYDGFNNLALKVQFERIERKANQFGAFIASPTLPRMPAVDNGMNVLTISLQGIF